MITEALGGVQSVVNVSAGSYESAHMAVVAVDPSTEMIRQRPIGFAPAVLARAESLPFHCGAFDTALAVLTIHHGISMKARLSKLRRIATRRVVILTIDPVCSGCFWLASLLSGR
jgi:ubiquinone/menaquinone biosynthesis C-methylase UbiE